MVKKKKRGWKKFNLFLLFVFFASVMFSAYLYLEYQNSLNEEIFISGINESLNIQKNLTYPPTNIMYNCTKDSDCVWMSTNCCSENEGAYWECVNKNSYIDCKSKMILCPQVISPKPDKKCSCIGGSCVAED